MVERLRPDEAAHTDRAVERAADRVRAGAIVAFPTETFYGLAVDPRLARAVRALLDAKGRPDGRALPLIAANVDQVELVAEPTPLATALASSCWPGPLTLIMPARAGLAPGVAAPDGSVAVRVPDDRIARALAATAGTALTATSANRSGEPPPTTPDAVEAGLGSRIDLIVDAGPTPGGAPSTIVDTRGSRLVLVREGAVPWARVLESLEE